MTSLESSGLNAGYVSQLLEQYLDNPEAVDPAWRAVFEGGDGDLLSALPGLERLVRTRAGDAGNGSATVEAPAEGEQLAEVAPVATPAPAPTPPAALAAPEAPAHPTLAGVAAALGGRRRDVAGEGLADARTSERAPRPARIRADGRSRPRRDPARSCADTGAAGANPGPPPSALRPGRHAPRSATSAARGLHRD